MYYPYEHIKRVAKLNRITIIKESGICEEKVDHYYVLRSKSKNGKVRETYVDSYLHLEMLFMVLPIINRHFNTNIKLPK
jgi:hypothetical protein